MPYSGFNHRVRRVHGWSCEGRRSCKDSRRRRGASICTACRTGSSPGGAAVTTEGRLSLLLHLPSCPAAVAVMKPQPQQRFEKCCRRLPWSSYHPYLGDRHRPSTQGTPRFRGSSVSPSSSLSTLDRVSLRVVRACERERLTGRFCGGWTRTPE